jgi:PAS domain S-box-containing protein
MAKKRTYEELEKRIGELEQKASERSRVEKELLSSQERFRIVADFTHDWEYWVGSDGNYVYVSPSCEKMTGYRPDEFQKDPGLLATITHPDDRELIARHVNEELESREVMTLDFRVITRSNDTRWIAHVCQQVYSVDGRFLGRRASNRDITERKKAVEALRESEARYRGIVEHTKSGVAVYRVTHNGEDFVFVDFNKSGEQIEKIQREELIGKSVVEVFPGVKEFGLLDVMRRVWATGKPERFPVSLYKDERIVGWRDNFVYKLPSGEIVCVYSDETERKQAEDSLRKAHEELYRFSQELEKRVQERTEELKEKNGQLVEAERLAARGKVANRVAHELRNPLTVIGGFARRMDEKTPDDDPNKKYLKVILSEIKVLENKVSQIIRFEDEG